MKQPASEAGVDAEEHSFVCFIGGLPTSKHAQGLFLALHSVTQRTVLGSGVSEIEPRSATCKADTLPTVLLFWLQRCLFLGALVCGLAGEPRSLGAKCPCIFMHRFVPELPEKWFLPFTLQLSQVCLTELSCGEKGGLLRGYYLAPVGLFSS